MQTVDFPNTALFRGHNLDLGIANVACLSVAVIESGFFRLGALCCRASQQDRFPSMLSTYK